MKVSANTFNAMPAELQALFSKCPNPGSDEVTRLFPETTSGSRHGYYENGAFSSGVVSKDLNGDSGSAARFFYCAKASKKDRDEGCEGLDEDARRMFASGGRTMKDGAWVETNSEPLPRRNFHPTVKPTDLMRYLCRLVTPPGGTVYDPFMGSGSTGKAAILEGFNFIGTELDAEYCEIARARIAAATDQTDMFTQATETGWRHDG